MKQTKPMHDEKIIERRQHLKYKNEEEYRKVVKYMMQCEEMAF